MDKFQKTIRMICWVMLALTVAILLYLGIVPSGHISYSTKFDKDSEFISVLSPKERLEEAEFPKVVIGNPAYFSLRTPRDFDQAVLHLKYKNKAEKELVNPIIEVGPLVDKTVWRYDLKPVENKFIDSIGQTWDKVVDGDLLLLQKNKKYDNMDDFLIALVEPGEIDLDKVAVYNYDLKTDYLLKEYKVSDKELVIDKALRGSYQFYTYLDEEDLEFAFDFVDLNENKDADKIDVRLYYYNELIDSRLLEDDGVASDSGAKSSVRRLNFGVSDLATGVYKIEVKVNDDIVTKKITTKQNKLAFVNGLRLHNADYKNLTIYTDSKKIQSKTIYPGLLQTIKAGENQLRLTETYKQFETDVKKESGTDKYAKIKLEHDGVFLSGNGVFGFTAEALLNPSIKKVDANLDIKNEGIEYILTRYQTPTLDNEWKSAVVVTDLRPAYRENGRYSFLISVPGLQNNDTIDDGIIFDEIRVDLTGWSLKDRFKNALNRL